MGRKEVDKGADKHIRITDVSLCEKIDDILRLPNYKSFNKVINDALWYGLDELHRKLFGDKKANEEPPQENAANVNGENMKELKLLLREIILNETLNKQMLSALYRAKSMELRGMAISGKLFEDGRMCETPECLAETELRELSKLSEEVMV